MLYGLTLKTVNCSCWLKYFMTYFCLPISQHSVWSEITSHNLLHSSVTKHEQFIVLFIGMHVGPSTTIMK